MMDKLLETAKEVIKSKKNNEIELSELWELVSKKCNLKIDDDLISDFYQEMIENNEFIKTPNNKWTLRELISHEQYNSISKALFNSNIDEVEENFKEFMSESEIKEHKNGYRNVDTGSLEVVDDEDEDDKPQGKFDDVIDEEGEYEE